MIKKCKYHCDYGDGEICHYTGKDGCVFNRGTRPMIDREKVIKWADICLSSAYSEKCNECPYQINHEGLYSCVEGILRDTLALLKEQETELCDRCGRRRLKSYMEVKEVLESTDKAGGCISENDVNKHYWQHPDADYNYMIP